MILIIRSVAWHPKCCACIEGSNVPFRDFWPHAVLNKNMGGHMSGMGDGGSRVCVFKCRLERNGCVNRIIECVDDIVRCTRMVFVFLKQFERNGAGAHVESFDRLSCDGSTG